MVRNSWATVAGTRDDGAVQVLLGADACRVLAQVFLLDGLLSAVDPSQLYDLPDNSADYVGTPPEPLTGDGVIYPA